MFKAPLILALTPNFLSEIKINKKSEFDFDLAKWGKRGIM